MALNITEGHTAERITSIAGVMMIAKALAAP